MPYKDKDKQRAYNLARMQCRRKKWFAENGPCNGCGSPNNLELDHIDPRKKVSHRVWSWSEQRLIEELLKCQILCKKCHKQKTRWQGLAKMTHGTISMYTNLRCRCKACRRAKSLLDPRRPEAKNPVRHKKWGGYQSGNVPDGPAKK